MSIDNNIKSARRSNINLSLKMTDQDVLDAFRAAQNEKTIARIDIIKAVKASLLKFIPDNGGVDYSMVYPLKTLVAKVVADNTNLGDWYSGGTIAQEVENAFRLIGGEVSYKGRKAMINFPEGSLF